MSRAVGSSAVDLCQHIFPIARKNNSLLDVTGVLLSTEDQFVQALEGPEAVVRVLFDKISKDTRHESIWIVKEGELPRRQFGAWAMAYDDRRSNALLSATTDDVLAGTDAARLF